MPARNGTPRKYKSFGKKLAHCFIAGKVMFAFERAIGMSRPASVTPWRTADTERFAQVIVGPGIQACYGIRLGDAAINMRTGVNVEFAQAPHDLDAVAARQHHLDDDRVVRIVRAHQFRGNAVGRGVDDVPAFLERSQEHVAQGDVSSTTKSFRVHFPVMFPRETRHMPLPDRCE